MSDETNISGFELGKSPQHQAKWQNDASYDALIADKRRDAREARVGAQLDARSAFLLPLVLALSRLAAQRHAGELRSPAAQGV